jgi:hypothetical protein
MYSSLIPLALNMFKDTNDSYINIMDSEKETISRLKFISKIQKGEKINTRKMYIQPEGILTTISRTFINHDNRINTLNFIHDTIYKSFDLLVKYDKSYNFNDRELCINLINDLKSSKTGLSHLKNTYITDLKFCCDMDTLLENIDAKLMLYIQKYFDNGQEVRSISSQISSPVLTSSSPNQYVNDNSI